MTDYFSLEGKNAVVIGGAGGVGEGIARTLAACGANVSIASGRIEHLMTAKEQIESAVNRIVSVYTVNAEDEESIRTLVDTVARDKGQVDILVNAQRGENEDLPMAVMREIFQENMIGIAMRCEP